MFNNFILQNISKIIFCIQTSLIQAIDASIVLIRLLRSIASFLYSWTIVMSPRSSKSAACSAKFCKSTLTFLITAVNFSSKRTLHSSIIWENLKINIYYYEIFTQLFFFLIPYYITVIRYYFIYSKTTLLSVTYTDLFL